jgi:2-keto-3-deoxy-L-rhamnonate aldolase RhmA
MTSTRASAAAASGPAPPSAPIVLTLWTDDPALARAADRAGVDRIGLDLERLGKQERQAHAGLWLTTHREESLPAVRASLDRGRLFARTNPPHDDWATEAKRLIGAGVEVLMLPAFHSAAEVHQALAIVAGRATLVPLIETVEAMDDIAAIASAPGLTEVHFGLNDLALALGLRDRFQVLTLPVLEVATRRAIEAGLRVGVGGIGRAHDATLPIPSDLIYAQYPRLGATGALIARSFFRGLAPGRAELDRAIAEARSRLDHWYRCDRDRLDAARDQLDRHLEASEERP